MPSIYVQIDSKSVAGRRLIESVVLHRPDATADPRLPEGGRARGPVAQGPASAQAGVGLPHFSDGLSFLN